MGERIIPESTLKIETRGNTLRYWKLNQKLPFYPQLKPYITILEMNVFIFHYRMNFD